MSVARPRALARASFFVVLLVTLLGAGSGPVAAAGSEAEQVIAIAKRQIGDPWVHGATGPDSFDCVGLVYFAFRKAGLSARIGGYRGVAAYRQWFADRGRVSRSNGRRGDLVIWGRDKHIGIYLGRGRAISALLSDVKTHGIHQLTDPFTVFLHVRLRRG